MIVLALLGAFGIASAFPRGPVFEMSADISARSGEKLGSPTLRLEAYEEGSVTVGPDDRAVTLTATVKAQARARCRRIDLTVNQTEQEIAGPVRSVEASTNLVMCEGQLTVVTFSEGLRIALTVNSVFE